MKSLSKTDGLALTLASLVALPISGCTQTAGVGEAVSTRMILADVRATLDEVADFAANRLDLSLLKATIEARATVDQVSLDLQDSLDHGVDRLDDQQRRAVRDLEVLTQTLEGVIRATVTDPVDAIRQDTLILLSRDPGHLRLSQDFASVEDGYIEVTALGTALSRMSVERLDLNTGTSFVQIEPTIAFQDDRELRFRIPFGAEPIVRLLDETAGDRPSQELLFRFEFQECSFFGLWCSSRHYAFQAYLVPRLLGTASATFVGDVSRSRTEKRRMSFTTKTIMSGGRYRRERTRHTFSVHPHDGWRIDQDSARYSWRLHGNDCSSRRSYARWGPRDEGVLSVDILVVTDRTLTSKPCSASVEITFEQWQPDTVEQRYTTGIQEVILGTDNEFYLEEDSSIDNARLAHVFFESEVFGRENHILRDGDEVGILGVEYDRSTQTAYLRVTNRRRVRVRQ